jgi:hypothetical protein
MDGEENGSSTVRVSPSFAKTGYATAERRSDRRYSFTAAATVLDTKSGARIDAHTTDLSFGGCYVDTMNPFPVGTFVELRLTKGGKSFESMGDVVYSKTGMGMGISFSPIERAQSLRLEEWLAELRGERPHEPHSLEHDEPPPIEAVAKDPTRYALEELLVQLMRKGLLSEEEGQPILRRLLY